MIYVIMIYIIIYGKIRLERVFNYLIYNKEKNIWMILYVTKIHIFFYSIRMLTFKCLFGI